MRRRGFRPRRNFFLIFASQNSEHAKDFQSFLTRLEFQTLSMPAEALLRQQSPIRMAQTTHKYFSTRKLSKEFAIFFT
jgi:hypothetical protein